MGILLFVFGALALTVAGMIWLALAGFRHGDRLLDAVVTAELQQSAQPDESRPVVVAEIRNSSESTVLVGLAARRSRVPGWLGGGSVGVPRHTARRTLRAGQYPIVGIVPASGSTRLTVPVTGTGDRYQLTAVIGQAGGRLRVHRLMVDDRARLWLPVADLTGWPS
jgi:hypothetical protein